MSARLRPRFQLRVDLAPDSVMEVFQAEATPDGPCALQLYERQVEFSVPESRRHFWSPFLNLIVETAPGGAVLHGKYGPNVNVWTMFMAAYAVCFFGAVAGFFIGTSQLQLKGEQPLTGFYLVAGAAAAAATIYAIGRVGRHLAHPQMLEFHGCVREWFGSHIVDLLDEETD